AERLLALLRAGVEHDALAEDRRHERIRRGLVELLVGGAEERLLRLLAREHDDALAREPELADLAALVAHALEQLERRAPHLEQVAEERHAAREARRLLPARRARDGRARTDLDRFAHGVTSLVLLAGQRHHLRLQVLLEALHAVLAAEPAL